MKFSEYIQNAFEKNLVLADRYEHIKEKAQHQLYADITS